MKVFQACAVSIELEPLSLPGFLERAPASGRLASRPASAPAPSSWRRSPEEWRRLVPASLYAELLRAPLLWLASEETGKAGAPGKAVPEESVARK